MGVETESSAEKSVTQMGNGCDGKAREWPWIPISCFTVRDIFLEGKLLHLKPENEEGGGCDMCPNILWPSYADKMEIDFPRLECELNLVTCF